MIRVVINKKNANEMSRYFVPKLFIISRLNRPVVSQYIYTSRGRIHWKLTDLKIPWPVKSIKLGAGIRRLLTKRYLHELSTVIALWSRLTGNIWNLFRLWLRNFLLGSRYRWSFSCSCYRWSAACQVRPRGQSQSYIPRSGKGGCCDGEFCIVVTFKGVDR